MDIKKSLEAAELLQKEYKNYRQHVALEQLEIIQKEQAKEKLKFILDFLKKECEPYEGFMAVEMKRIIQNILTLI